MTVDDLAERVHLDLDHLVPIERGVEVPDSTLAARLEQLFG